MKIPIENRNMIARIRGLTKVVVPFGMQTLIIRNKYGVKEVLSFSNVFLRFCVQLLPYGVVRFFWVQKEIPTCTRDIQVLPGVSPGEHRNGVVYTCITGGYDSVIQQACVNARYDYVCFTDNENMIDAKHVNGWEIRPLVFDKLDNVRNARWHKTHPHLLFPDKEYSVWIDGNVLLRGPHLYMRVDELLLQKVELSVPCHPKRHDIYEEAGTVIKLGKDDANIVNAQIRGFREMGFPEKTGLHETNIVFRQHHSKELISLMNHWWMCIAKGSRRDQLSFDYVLWSRHYSIVDFCDCNGIWGNAENYRIIGFTSHSGRSHA